jgi:hypothetical protein
VESNFSFWLCAQDLLTAPFRKRAKIRRGRKNRRNSGRLFPECMKNYNMNAKKTIKKKRRTSIEISEYKLYTNPLSLLFKRCLKSLRYRKRFIPTTKDVKIRTVLWDISM